MTRVRFDIVCRAPLSNKMKATEFISSDQAMTIPNSSNATVGCMATFPARFATLDRVVARLTPQLDRLYVYINDADAVPDVLIHPKIVPILGKDYDGNLSANGKVFPLQYISDSYVFLLDDDMLFPVDYVETMKKFITDTKRAAAVCVHGSMFSRGAQNYFDRADVYAAQQPLDENRFVSLVGSGTFAFHQSTLRAEYRDFLPKVMVDLTLSFLAKDQNVPLFAIARDAEWLKFLSYPGLWEVNRSQVTHHTPEMLKHGPWEFDAFRSSYEDLTAALGGLAANGNRARWAKRRNIDSAVIAALADGSVPKHWIAPSKKLVASRMKRAMWLPQRAFRALVPTGVRNTVPVEWKRAVAGQVRRLMGGADARMPLQADPYSVRLGADLRGNFYLQFIAGAFKYASRVPVRFRASGTPYSLIIAHELKSSGFWGLEFSKLQPDAVTVMDSVEFPKLSGRSTTSIAARALEDPTSDALITATLGAVANQYDFVLTTSHGQATTLRTMGVGKTITVVRNARELPLGFAVDPTQSPIRELTGCKVGDALVLYNNHIYVNGGAEEFVLSVRHLPPHYRGAFLGEFRDNLAEKISQLATDCGIGDRIVSIPPVAPSELVKFISGADAAIIPLLPNVENHVKCLPNRIFEAYAANLPIVAYAKSEIGQFVTEHGIGRTFESFEEREMARVIQDVVETGRYGGFDRALQVARDDINWSTESRKLDAILDQVDKSKPRTCLLVACKEIDRNDRVFRMTKYLVASGFSVDVVCQSLPMDELRVPGVAYYKL
jgi:hypothetical protein